MPHAPCFHHQWRPAVGFHLAVLVLLIGTSWAGDAPLLGEGSHRYRWVADWAKLPPPLSLAPTHGCVAVDSRDRIFVNTDGKDGPILIFNADGSFVKSIGREKAGGPHGMIIVKEGENEVLWLARHEHHEVVKMTLDGEALLTIPWPEKSGLYKKASEFRPTSVAIAPNGDVYVADGYGKNCVHQFHADGTHVRSWNGKEGKAGIFKTPHGIAVDTRGKQPRVIVADRENRRLQFFTLDGDYLNVLTGFNRPCMIIIRAGDMVIPELLGRVTIVTGDDHHIHLGENPDKNLRGRFSAPVTSWRDGEFIAPHGAAWDSQGNLYVEDWSRFGRISKLERVR